MSPPINGTSETKKKGATVSRVVQAAHDHSPIRDDEEEPGHEHQLSGRTPLSAIAPSRSGREDGQDREQ